MINFDPNTATSRDLDEIAITCGVVRKVLGVKRSDKPCDNCYWDQDMAVWVENDQTVRSRIESERAK